MSRFLWLPAIVITCLTPAGAAAAQTSVDGPVPLATDAELTERYPEIAALLRSVPLTYGALLEELHTDPGAPVAASSVQTLLEQARTGSSPDRSFREAMPTFAAFAPDLVETLEWGAQLEYAIYDVYAAEDVADRQAAVARILDRYLARADLALPPTPRTRVVVAGHDHHVEDHYQVTLESAYSRENGLLWASDWLRMAVFDPLLYYIDPAEKRAGLEAVRARFDELTTDPPASSPARRPTLPAIAPALFSLHPDAAAIVDNLAALRADVADVLVQYTGGGKREALTALLEEARDPEHMAVDRYDWFLESLRGGIFFQGGPAIGSLESSERNHGDHSAHEFTMPGMGQ